MRVRVSRRAAAAASPVSLSSRQYPLVSIRSRRAAAASVCALGVLPLLRRLCP
jgi:hypothetical protein